MGFYARSLTQTVTYWGSPVPDGAGGHTFAAPRLLDARWEDSNELFTDPSGRQVVAKAQVFVDEDVSIGGYLYLGETAATDPTGVAGAHKIRGFSKVSDLVGTETERKAWL